MDKIYCVFGDSVVQAGYAKISWADHLKNFLEKKYQDDFVDVYDLGIGGNTTDDILNRLAIESAAREPTSLIFGIGVNDSGYFRIPSKPIVKKTRFVANLEQMITIAKKFTTDITFIGLTLGDDSLIQPFPGSSQGKSYTTECVKTYDKVLKEIAEKNNCRYIYLFDILNFADFQDGLHPNAKGHQKMFKEIKKYF